MKKTFIKAMKISVLAALIAVTVLFMFSCRKAEDNAGTENAEKTITVEVISKSGASTVNTITTSGKTLADALVESGLVEDNQDDYGLYILTVNGETADYSVDQSYWAISKDGEDLMTGASQTDIADGEHYELTYTVYNG